jgi:hypothetical protein
VSMPSLTNQKGATSEGIQEGADCRRGTAPTQSLTASHLSPCLETLTATVLLLPDHQDLIADLEGEIDRLHDSSAKGVLVGGCFTVVIGFIWHRPLALLIAIGRPGLTCSDGV